MPIIVIKKVILEVTQSGKKINKWNKIKYTIYA